MNIIHLFCMIIIIRKRRDLIVAPLILEDIETII